MYTYTVQTGDTLASIAKRFYNDYTKYTLIAQVNHIQNPANIGIGQVLKIPILSDGKTPATVEIDASTFPLPSHKYYSEIFPKTSIVLHFTAGLSAQSAYHTFLRLSSRTATSYIIDRDGKIYELFPPRFWALHLFRHQHGEPPIYYQLEQKTIAVELVNVGPLKPDASNRRQLNWWWPPHPITGKETFGTRWCELDEVDKYVKKHDRGIDYFATFTEDQYESAKKLLEHLGVLFGIPMLAPVNKLTTELENMITFRGITSHQKYRQDKWDIGPAFDWTKVGL